MSVRWLALSLVAVVVTLAGCAGAAPDPGVVRVAAASSLTTSFTEISAQFEAANPGTDVELMFAGSADLLSQLDNGAPSDVFAAADLATMAKAQDTGLVAGPPQVFATNSMMIAVPPDNPRGIDSLADLTSEDLSVVVCAPIVPCGAATIAVLDKAGVDLTPVSEESAVADVRNKVATGQADAGIVYVTDVRGSAGAVTGVVIPARDNVTNEYAIAQLQDRGAAELAQQFVEFVVGPGGREVLADDGFGTP